MKNVLDSLHSLLKSCDLQQMWVIANKILFAGQLSEMRVTPLNAG